MDDYKWKKIPGRQFGGGSEALWGQAVQQIGKMRFGRCSGEVAFPPSRDWYIFDCPIHFPEKKDKL